MQAGRTRNSTADSCKKESLTDDEIPLGLAVSRSSGMFCEFIQIRASRAQHARSSWTCDAFTVPSRGHEALLQAGTHK